MHKAFEPGRWELMGSEEEQEDEIKEKKIKPFSGEELEYAKVLGSGERQL